MFTKRVFLLAVVCVTMTSAAVPYGGKGPVPGGNGGMPGGTIPGGIGECLAIEPLHAELADFAINEKACGYFLLQILGVRAQVVSGIMYHMELYVSKNGKCEHCDVKVWYRSWIEGQKMTLNGFVCKETCCRH